MLVLKLKASDTVMIGAAIVNVREIGNGRVRLAIDAPEHIPISNESVTKKATPQGD